MPTLPGVWSLGLFSLTFFSTSLKKKGKISEGNQALEQMVGPSVHESGGGGYLAPSGPMPQPQGGVRHGLEASRFPDPWPLLGGWAYSPGPPQHAPGGPWVWSFRAP